MDGRCAINGVDCTLFCCYVMLVFICLLGCFMVECKLLPFIAIIVLLLFSLLLNRKTVEQFNFTLNNKSYSEINHHLFVASDT